MKYQIIPVTPFQQNCSLIWCEKTKRAAVVDPGGNIDRIQNEVTKLGLVLDKIILTHGHIDHVGGAKALAQAANVPIIGPHIADKFWIENLPKQSQNFGFPHCDAFEPDQYLQDGDNVQVGEQSLSVLHCPGHTPGHIALFSAQSKLAWVGDILFRSSIGRTDFPQSNHQDLIHSITEKLWPLGVEVEFIPGHGPMSTFGEEREHNPFVADQLLL
ncbi:MBL fold metallo-hydrolase [Shewanella baltica]|uniref:MBL fold metallo-hydrolase n=1 Tax=Shewanella baltica TaxID=62322 RepID=UPI00217E0751|nr:MBL fold metallo-hydrolase [Shewanella baltica]MCS6101089.1 MBL fold metallo-hydrolase [Shewanella baltica]MCS6184177.1 MBL fold metallo-hydrolase [Shewanella baltica]MCS6235288.1 MBL fold metallo-hydrolase [Shewanella baltica]MCS6269895.1 MBL fold metallo-hydrolase [Shewanella baltica]